MTMMTTKMMMMMIFDMMIDNVEEEDLIWQSGKQLNAANTTLAMSTSLLTSTFQGISAWGILTLDSRLLFQQ